MANAEQPTRSTAYTGLVRPDAITKLPNLNADQKSRFYSAVQQWWSIIESSAPETAQHQAALTKLRDMTKSVANIWRGNQQAARNGQAASSAQQQAVPAQSAQQLQQSDAKRPQANAAAPQQAGGPAQGQAAGQQRRPQPSKEILAHVESFPYVVPPQYQEGSEEANNWLVTTKQNYGQLLGQFEIINAQSSLILKKVEATKSTGQSIPENFLQSYKGLMHKKELLKKQIEAFRLQQSKLKQAVEAAAESNANAATPGQASSPTASAPPTTHPQASTSAPSQTPTSAPTARPSINTNQPSLGSAPPSAATPTAPIAPQQPQHQRSGEGPLTHQGALDAARAFRDTQPSRAAPSMAFPDRDLSASTSQASMQRNHAIPRSLSATLMGPPHPVQVAPARPTLAGAGAINQPTLTKPPPFQLEGEGASHVLSKRKLDELVRQVTGGAETLSPEVEEVRSRL